MLPTAFLGIVNILCALSLLICTGGGGLSNALKLIVLSALSHPTIFGSIGLRWFPFIYILNSSGLKLLLAGSLPTFTWRKSVGAPICDLRSGAGWYGLYIWSLRFRVKPDFADAFDA